MNVNYLVFLGFSIIIIGKFYIYLHNVCLKKVKEKV